MAHALWLCVENLGYRLAEFARRQREDEFTTPICAWIEREFLR